MFGPDYLCIALALAMLSTIPLVALWPDSESKYRRLEQERRDRKTQKRGKQPTTILYPVPKERTETP